MAIGMAGSWKLDTQRSVEAGPLPGLRAGFGLFTDPSNRQSFEN
jgi:hypothetical protein